MSKIFLFGFGLFRSFFRNFQISRFCFLLKNLVLGCHSSKILHIFGKLDYSGIALLTMGSFVPWVYYTFYCETQSKIVYMGTQIFKNFQTFFFEKIYKKKFSDNIRAWGYCHRTEPVGAICEARISYDACGCIFITWVIWCHSNVTHNY